MAERSSAIVWVLNCPIYLLRCYKSFAPLETVAKEPKRFELPDPPKRKRRKNLFQIIFVWLRRIWSKLWRRDQ
jgi:hypothetical protein